VCLLQKLAGADHQFTRRPTSRRTTRVAPLARIHSLAWILCDTKNGNRRQLPKIVQIIEWPLTGHSLTRLCDDSNRVQFLIFVDGNGSTPNPW